jgi:hypothetical protein
VKVIINAEPDEIEAVAKLVMESREQFDRHPERIGWGWTFCSAQLRRSFFIRQIKGGLSARPVNMPKGDG